MGWKHINGGQYYYKARREGGRVVTSYYGEGKLALLVAELDDIDRADRLVARTLERQARHEAREVDLAIDRLVAEVRRLADAQIEANGYHRHKGQWRRIRKAKA